MKTETVDVKSKGEVVSTVEVPVFESMEEAINEKGEGECLNLINRQNKSDIVNAERALKTRGTSLQAQVTRALKGKSREECTAIVEQLGLDIDLDTIYGEAG
jgi:hypothetical protein